jgi:Flp pilus assembly protein TadD
VNAHAKSVALIVAAVVIAYANSLNGPFILDDYAAIVGNTSIHDLWNPAVLTPAPELPVSGRPVANVSFAVSYAIGGLSETGYHAANIAIHLACALLLFGLLHRTLNAVALVAALIWAIHPLNTEAVDYMTQRTELLLGLFYLLTMYAGVRALSTPRRLLWQSIAVASCALGMGSKESMVTAPLMAVLYDRSFAYGSFRQAFAKRWRFYGALAGTWLVLAAVVATSPRTVSAGFSSGVSPATYLWNQAILVPHYLRLAIWPRGLAVDYGWPLPLRFADVLPQVALLAGLVTLTIVALARWPRIGLWGAWFFITLAPTSSLVPIATEVGAERRMYLPLAGLAVLFTIALARVAAAAGRAREMRVTIAAGAAIASALTATTIARNREYASPLVLARVTVERWPSAVAHATYGVELDRTGKHDGALAELRQAVAGGDFRAEYPLGGALFDAGRTDEAIAHLRAYLNDGSGPQKLQTDARRMLATAYFQKQNWPAATSEFERVLSDTPDDGASRRYLADALFAQHAYEPAAAAYEHFLEVRPTDVDALTNLGISLAATGKTEPALAAFRRASSADPRNLDARTNVVQMLLLMGRYDEAEAQARDAARLNPADPRARDLIDRVGAARRR